MALDLYVQENDASEQRLIQVVNGLSEADYAADLSGGWTVTTALAHLAFWDTCRLAQLKQWELAGISPIPNDSSSINAGVEVLASTISGAEAGKLAIRAAQAIDSEVRKASPEFVKVAEDAGQLNVLRRSEHRHAHLDQIAKALKHA
ncbi:MAG TPA: hypothetical protein VGK87_12705 [Anaerolineae bacterium]